MANTSNRRIPDRAMQFAPFAALKGYYDHIKAEERITQPMKELSEDDSEIISNTLNTLRAGMTVRVRYYDVIIVAGLEFTRTIS